MKRNKKLISAISCAAIAAATCGSIKINNVIPKHLEAIAAKLEEVGAEVEMLDDSVIVIGRGNYKRTNITTLPYPGFPTDMHPQMAPLLSIANGQSRIRETIWPKRFRYVEELKLMGADITVNEDTATAIINGVDALKPAKVKAVDLRAGLAVLIAGLMTEGTTEIYDIKYIERGYENIVSKLSGLGARIKKVPIGDE